MIEQCRDILDMSSVLLAFFDFSGEGNLLSNFRRDFDIFWVAESFSFHLPEKKTKIINFHFYPGNKSVLEPFLHDRPRSGSALIARTSQAGIFYETNLSFRRVFFSNELFEAEIYLIV